MARKSSKDTKRKRRLWLRVGVQTGGLALLVVFVLREHQVFQGFTSTLGRLDWPLVMAAFAAELASIPPLAEAQRVVLRTGGTSPPHWYVALVMLAGNAISMSVPVGVPAAEGYAYTKFRRYGVRKAIAAWAELAAGAIAYATLAVLALFGAAMAGGRTEGIVLGALSVVVVGATATALMFRHPRVLVRGLEWMERRVGRRVGGLVRRATKRARDMAQSLKDVKPSIGAWGIAAGLSLVNWLLDAWCLALSFQAIHVPVPWGVVLLAFAGAKVLSSFGFTPGGIGIVEGGLVALFVAYGTKASDAVAGVIVYRAITYIGLVGLGWLVAGAMAVRTYREQAAT
jgi:putative heme transporter